ncbi:putative membrane protein [Stackebrandtia albiflava]|uniref:Putative membrane protein n=1 Tax=Stackebrandtia albiflava TaxID=406432 RepID=A0A562VAF0_9ACTN|nr:DUF2231 domain-containing protein [Stackebrandtia albiflava]TWJ14870.1 putative membrane protein [Stackebrandtia albiflava]
MRSRFRAAGHAVHPMLIVFPLGLLATAVIFDVLRLITGNEAFAVVAAYTMAAGIIGGLAAGVTGLVDWLAIPAGTRAKRVGAVHGAGNLLVLALFAVSWLLRLGGDDWVPGAWAMILGFAGAALAGVTAWLGGELVERLGVSVDDGARLDAPSSLRAPHA